MENLSGSKSLDDLKEKLSRENIETLYKYKRQTNELQGISFKIGKHKYKGSEIGRKFSIRNLEKIIEQQGIKNMLHPRVELPKSKQNLKDEHQDIKEHRGHNKNVMDILLKPEKEHHQMQEPLLIKKHSKKKSRGLHL